ncbi:MAG: hypothetical protein ACI93T_001355 [Porticoccaceae bacterium]|jgi:hypothetical protein
MRVSETGGARESSLDVISQNYVADAIRYSGGDRRVKRTHFGELIGVENGPTVAVSGSFELFSFEASEAKDAEGGRLRTDQACSS